MHPDLCPSPRTRTRPSPLPRLSAAPDEWCPPLLGRCVHHHDTINHHNPPPRRRTPQPPLQICIQHSVHQPRAREPLLRCRSSSSSSSSRRTLAPDNRRPLHPQGAPALPARRPRRPLIRRTVAIAGDIAPAAAKALGPDVARRGAVVPAHESQLELVFAPVCARERERIWRGEARVRVCGHSGGAADQLVVVRGRR